MCFPSSKNGGRQPCGTHLSSLNNTGRSGVQAPRVWAIALAALLAAASCNRRAANQSRKRPGPLPDGGATLANAPPSPSTTPPMKALPETAPAIKTGGRHGGTLRVHLEAEPPHLNPLQDTLQVIERVTAGLVYETLIQCQPDGYGPGLAESWEVAPDGMRINLRLRAGPRWHDDKALSVMDVQATFEHLMRAPSRSPPLHALIADLEMLEVMPDRAVRLRLLRPSGLALRALCEIPILPAEPLRAGGQPLAQLGRAPVGTGPFRFAGWERGKRIKLARARPSAAAGSPYLDEIVFEIDPDPARALTRLRRGEFDVLPKVAELHYPEQVSQATLRDVLDLYVLSPHRYSFVALNVRRGILANASFRHALSLLWDRPRFAAEFHRGLARPIGGPTFGTAPPDPFDRVGATAVLEQAGLQDTDGDGVRDVGGSPIRLTFLLPSGSRTLAAEVKSFAMDMRRAGLLLDTASLDGAALFARVERGDFDMAALTWEGRADEDPRLLLTGQGEFQYTGYRPERLAVLVDLVRVAATPAARRPLLAELAGLLATDRPTLFLYRHDVPVLVSKRVHGLLATLERLDFRAVWVDP